MKKFEKIITFEEKEQKVQEFFIKNWEEIREMLDEADVDISTSKVGYSANKIDARLVHEKVSLKLGYRLGNTNAPYIYGSVFNIYAIENDFPSSFFSITYNSLVPDNTPYLIDYIINAAEKFGRPEIAKSLRDEFKVFSADQTKNNLRENIGGSDDKTCTLPTKAGSYEVSKKTSFVERLQESRQDNNISKP